MSYIKSTPYHPQTNGAIERFNAIFERQLAKVTNVYMDDWDIHLKSIVFAYNTGKHAATEYSPYQLQFGRHPNLPPDSPTNINIISSSSKRKYCETSTKL
jgi:transposase InsO family protein